MRIPYRNKLLLKKLLRTLAVLIVLAAIGAVVALIYLEPRITYDRDGAHLDAPLSDVAVRATEPRPTLENPQIVYQEEPVDAETIQEMGGYYITTEMLRDPQAVLAAVKALDEPCAVMLELKSIWGNFYYSTSVGGASTASVDVTVVDELISYLKTNGFYLIASMPAFSDSSFALANQSCGLPIRGGALWMDENGCYWLDPANENVIAYLLQVARDLQSRGFSEVAFSHFLFPASQNIVYSSDVTTSELISDAVGQVSSIFKGDSFSVSFVTDATDFPAENCTGRLYITGADGTTVERFAQAYRGAESVKELVFLSSSKDTRFAQQAVLRPLPGVEAEN